MPRNFEHMAGPSAFGADPSGKTDSTAAFVAAVKALTDLGGATDPQGHVDLGGAILAACKWDLLHSLTHSLVQYHSNDIARVQTRFSACDHHAHLNADCPANICTFYFFSHGHTDNTDILMLQPTMCTWTHSGMQFQRPYKFHPGLPISAYSAARSWPYLHSRRSRVRSCSRLAVCATQQAGGANNKNCVVGCVTSV